MNIEKGGKMKEEQQRQAERRPFKRVDENDWLGGVCGGLAYCLGCPTWIVRLIWTASCIYYGVGVVPYILLWFFAPEWDEDPEDYKEVTS